MSTIRQAMAIAGAFILLLAIPFYAQAQGADRFLDVIVVLDDDLATGSAAANRARAAQVAQGFGVTPRYAYGKALFGFAARVPEHRLAALRQNPSVAYVNLDGRVHAVAPKWCGDNPDHPACKDDDEEDGGGGSDPQTLPWGVDRIDADANANAGGTSHVYVLDTGIDLDHPDLQANIGNSVNCLKSSGGPPWSRTYTCESGGDDDNGHGTHVAGTIAALDNDIDVVGVAPEATLHAVKVLDKNGSGNISAVIAGIDWVAGQVGSAAVAANMSLGGSGSKSGTCSDGSFSGDDSFHEAICNATNAGVVFAVAAGNDGADAEDFTPAAYDDATVAVSATDSGDDWPSWSNWGDNAASWIANDSAPVAIAAPGVDILSTWNDGGTHTISGTSMATPHVAGAVALYLNSNPQSPDYSAFQNSRGTVLSTAEDSSGFSNTSGNPHAEDFLDAEGL